MKPQRESPPTYTDVINVGMQKGGVGKTTNSLHLAAALAGFGRRVLLWDVDENYGATKVFGLAASSHATTMDVLVGDCEVHQAILRADSGDIEVALPENLDFIPSSRALQGLERRSGASPGTGVAGNCLAPHLGLLRGSRKYDYIFLDTGPHASATTRSAYLTSDYIILSVTPEQQAIASLPDALRDIANARKPNRNPALTLLGLIMTGVDKRMYLPKYYEGAIDRGFLDRDGRKVKFATTIGSAAAIDRAYQQHKLLLQMEPSHRVSKQYVALAREVETRIARHRSATDAAHSTRTTSEPAEVASG